MYGSGQPYMYTTAKWRVHHMQQVIKKACYHCTSISLICSSLHIRTLQTKHLSISSLLLLQIPGQMLLVALELFPKLDTVAAEAAISRLRPFGDSTDTSCIYDAALCSSSSSSLLDLYELTPPSSCNQIPLPEQRELQPPLNAVLPGSHSHSSDGTTATRLHRRAGQAGLLAAAFRYTHDEQEPVPHPTHLQVVAKICKIVEQLSNSSTHQPGLQFRYTFCSFCT